ncbi:MAG: phosphate ABC transporter permease subunit PstC [Planctomycetota bacterium]
MFLFKNDLLSLLFFGTLASVSVALIVFILFFLNIESLLALRELGLWRTLSDPSWHPTQGEYNLTPMLLGTFWATLGAVLLATPLGLFSALFCHYYAPVQLAYYYRRMIEVFGGIPSVIYGLWGLTVLVPWIQKIHPPGPSLLAGILILTLMILPTIVLVLDMALTQIPVELIQGSVALGLSRLGLLRCVVYPSIRSPLISAILLAGTRAIGETMAVLMVCGNLVQIPRGLFDPIRTLTTNIALEMAYALGVHRSSLFLGSLFLLGMVVLLLFLSLVLTSRKRA